MQKNDNDNIKLSQLDTAITESHHRHTDTQTHTHTIMVLPMVEYNERLKTNKDGYRKKGEPKNQWILFV